MVYIYRKRIGDKDYYYLRASVLKEGKLITKDILYLGDDLILLEIRLKTFLISILNRLRRHTRL